MIGANTSTASRTMVYLSVFISLILSFDLVCNTSPKVLLVAGRHWNVDTFLGQLFPHPLELLVLGKLDRAVIAHALQLSRRILHIGFHEFLNRLADRDQSPCTLGVVVHEYVVTLLRILPEVEDLRNSCDVLLRAFPAQIRVHGETASRLSIVSTQIETRLVVSDPRRARR